MSKTLNEAVMRQQLSEVQFQLMALEAKRLDLVIRRRQLMALPPDLLLPTVPARKRAAAMADVMEGMA